MAGDPFARNTAVPSELTRYKVDCGHVEVNNSHYSSPIG